jgi:hypothetical protein
MMLSVYVTIFALASAATYVALTRRVDERLGGIVAALLWARLVPASFALQVASGGSILSVANDGPTAILAATLCILMIVFVVGYAFDYVPDMDATRFNNS